MDSPDPLPDSTRPVAPYIVGAVVLGLLLTALLLPSTGTAPAQTTCAYGVCPAAMGGSNSTWEVLLILLVVVAVALGILILRSRRRPPRGSSPPEEWSAGSSGAVGPVEEAAPAGALGGVGGAPYVERPEDVGAVPPDMPTPQPASGPTEAGAGDIDSLMAELDKIGNEILTRGPKGKKGEPPSPAEDEGTEPAP